MATRPRVRRDRSDVVAEFVTSVLLMLLGAWVFMLLVGVIHHEWIAALPTLDWWSSLLIIVMADIVTNCVTYGARVKTID